MLFTLLVDGTREAPVPVWQPLLQYGAVGLATIVAVLITQFATSWREGRQGKASRTFAAQQRLVEQGRDSAKECLSVLSEALTDADADPSLVDWRVVSIRVRRECSLIGAKSVRSELGRGAACLPGLADTLSRPADAKALLGSLHALTAAWLREDAVEQASLEKGIKAVVVDVTSALQAKVGASLSTLTAPAARTTGSCSP